MDSNESVPQVVLRSNPPNPFTTQWIEWIDAPEERTFEVYEERAKSALSENDSPDIPFRYSLNPYRGCFHACAYCYACPTHQYLDFGAGNDFEQKIIVKINAPEKLEERFCKSSWSGEEIIFSGVTDCYQPLEASYEITRKCLLVCAKYRNPVGIITKGALIRRDIDVLLELQRHASVKVYFSIAFSDDDISKALEPHAPRPSTRFRAMRELSQAGIPVGVSLAPLIPGLNDHMIPQLLEAAYDAGARSSFITLLRLPREVREVFLERLQRAFPGKYNKILNKLERMRSGKVQQADWFKRMRGEGKEWEAALFLYNESCRRLGMHAERDLPKINPAGAGSTFRRPSAQLSLFPE